MAKTLQEKLASAVALVEKYTQQINAEALLNNVAVGNDIGFIFGRAEKARTLRGVVTAVRDASETEGKLYRVVINGGTFEEQAFKVRPDQVTENFSAVADEAVEGDDSPLSED